MRKKKILVIDDDEMNLQIAKMILERKLPCEVIGVDNGLEGLDILRSQHISLVLLDILMPDFDGIETLQEIRGDSQIKDVPIMMLTASGDIENIQKVGELGVKDYIKKPFMPADLIKRVEKKLSEIHLEEILLLGDDEETLQEMCKIIEENFPHEALIATSTSKAQTILDETKINLIIADANIKFVRGLKFLSFIASDETLKKIPFAVTTPDNLLELIEKLNPQEEISPPVEEPEIIEPTVEEKIWIKPSVEEQVKAEPPIVEEVAKSPVVRTEKKKLANVVTTLIGYDLDIKI